jgi:hypothetical protein
LPTDVDVFHWGKSGRSLSSIFGPLGEVPRFPVVLARHRLQAMNRALERQGITDSITDNGVHYGVEVRGKVFDNLSPEGLAIQDWVNDFHCLSDEFDLVCLEDG